MSSSSSSLLNKSSHCRRDSVKEGLAAVASSFSTHPCGIVNRISARIDPIAPAGPLSGPPPLGPPLPGLPNSALLNKGGSRSAGNVAGGVRKPLSGVPGGVSNDMSKMMCGELWVFVAAEANPIYSDYKNCSAIKNSLCTQYPMRDTVLLAQHASHT